MLIDFHGSFKPTGLRRAYPNVITREGVRGLENCKWGDAANPEYNVTIPFIRMAAGPMDYTPGAMVNAQKSNFRPIFNRPMSLGTRCHQLAMYVVYESPLQMLADTPTNYLREKECMKFLAKVPTVWDETRFVDGTPGEYIILARRKGDVWYVGGMTNWEGREVEISLDFMGAGTWKARIWADGAKVDKNAEDIDTMEMDVDTGAPLAVKMAPGGGFVAALSK